MGVRRFRQNPKTGRMEGAYGGPGETPPTAAPRPPAAAFPAGKPATATIGDIYSYFRTITAPDRRWMQTIAATFDTPIEEVEAHYQDLLAEHSGSTADATLRLSSRCRQQRIVSSAPGIVALDPPGSQSDQYVLDSDGRPAELYYASYGSNLSADRFHVYLHGGSIAGAGRLYPGAREHRPVADDIPVALNGTIFYAGQSRAWGGGVAFLDHTSRGHALGRAYLITGSQFDDVVAQENTCEPGTVQVDTATCLADGRTVTPGVYGTLVHVGDYRGRPVVTFTSPFTAADAHRGHLTVTPEGQLAERAARDADVDRRRAEHDRAQQQLPIAQRTPFKEDWHVFANTPTAPYLEKISAGLKETFHLPDGKVRDYFAGSM